MAQMGSGYHDQQNDEILVPTNQTATERWVDTVTRHGTELAGVLTQNPKNGNDDPPTGIPAGTTNLRVTVWKTADGLWHWVATERNPGEGDNAFDARHAAQVTAAQADYPPV